MSNMSELDIDLQDYADKCRAVAAASQTVAAAFVELTRFGNTLLADYDMRRPGSRDYIAQQFERIRKEEGI